MARKRKLPVDLPATVFSVLGPLPVALVPDLQATEECHGEVNFESRTVRLNTSDGKSTAAMQWQTYWHETTHVALWDGGVHDILTEKQREAVCDSIGTYLTAAMQAGFLTIPKPRTRNRVASVDHEGNQ